MFNPFKKLKNFIIRKSVETALKPIESRLEKLKPIGGNMRGWRTLLVNGGLVALAAFLQFVAGVNLADYGIDGTVATIILAVINFVLRFITTTPVGLAGK